MNTTTAPDWKLDETGFTLNTPQLYRSWYNYISNGEYGIKISHLGDGYATTLGNPRIAVSNSSGFGGANVAVVLRRA